jgi:hypothetical protein
MTQRLDAKSIKQLNGTDEALLAIIQNKIIENIERSAVSVMLKNKNLSGNPEAGSVEVKRFANALSQAYGTARTAGSGVNVKEDKVIILLDKDREIVEEIAKKDEVAYGIPAMIEKRINAQSKSAARELDRAFFTESVAGGTEFTPTVGATTLKAKIDEMSVSLQETLNQFVDGVDLEDLRLVLSVKTHDELKNEIIVLESSHLTTADGAVGLYAGIPVYISNRLPVGTKAILMVVDSVAQPVLFNDLVVGAVPFGVDTWVGNFYTFGTKVVTPDLILYLE